MMRGLFLKIFVWFWIVQFLIGAAMYTVISMTRPENARMRGMAGDALTWPAEDAATSYAEDGIAGLREFLNRRKRRFGTSQNNDRRGFLLAVYDAGGKRLAGPIFESADALALKAASKNETQWDTTDGRNLAARRARTTGGKYLVIVAQMRPQPPPGGGPLLYLLRPVRSGPIPILVLLVLSGLVCYGLASYLTSPAIKLRAATRRLANGDLGARVAAQMGRRRDELADLGHDFDAMAERIEVLMLSERRLLGDISHELRSPLARLTVALDLAAQNADERTNSYLGRIRRESERLNEMIGQLLALTRLESGETMAARAPVDLGKLVREVAADADFEARGNGREVRVEADECKLMGNAGLLRSAVENVVRNAVRYTAEGTAVDLELRCHDSRTGGKAVISVRDHGPGVPAASLEKIFNPFYRVADARDRKSGGTGLGLAIAQRAVRYHSGQVRAENMREGGLLVEIALPLGNAIAG